MRNLNRNTQLVFYKLYEGEKEIVLQPGDINTGIYAPTYSELKSAKLCVSPNKGSSEVNMFGTLEQYDRTMTTSDINCDIDETAVLWVDGADTDGAWNYSVKKRAPWKNSISYAITQVAVSVYQEQMKQMESAEKKARMVFQKTV